MNARSHLSSVRAVGRQSGSGPDTLDRMDEWDSWVSGYEDDNGLTVEHEIEQDWEDAAEGLVDLLHEDRMRVRDLSRLDDFDRATGLIERAADAEPLEFRIGDRRYYVRESLYEHERHIAMQQRGSLSDDHGEPYITGVNTPTQDEIAAAQSVAEEWATPDGRVRIQRHDRWTFHAPDGHELSEDLARTMRDRLRAGRINQGYGPDMPSFSVTVADVSVLKQGGYDLPIAHLAMVAEGQARHTDMPNGQLGVDGKINDGTFKGTTLRHASEALTANSRYRPPHFLGHAGTDLEQSLDHGGYEL